VNKTSLIRTGIIACACIEFSPPSPSPDPISQQLAICGDTPEPVIILNGTRLPMSAEQFSAAVKLVHDCRDLVINGARG
jgi:hypothetical protein